MLDRLRAAMARVDGTDRELARRSALLPRSAADPALKTLSTAANHSLLWLAIAAVLGLRGGRTRRAAVRGAAAIAGASATTNLVGKPLLPRRRPAAELVAPHRRLTDPPVSSSFPSGHAASAAAFATAVAMESPVLGAALAPVAAAVAYSRVHTGVHWPTDVVCGAALGTGMALSTRRWWPVLPEDSTEVEVAELPALPDGAGMLVLLNPDSGDGVPPAQWVTENWPAAKVTYPEPGGDLVADLDAVVGREQVRALGVAGGDGTVAAAATVAARRGLPLAVLPAGTLNHFARDAGVPTADAVADAVARGTGCAVDLGTLRVDDAVERWFLNTASIGGYPDMVRFRERWAPRWGKWPAAAAALIRVLHESAPMHAVVNGEPLLVWVLFVGNGAYAPRGFAPAWRPSLGTGTLDVRYVRADLRWSRLRFVAAALAGTLQRSRTYVERRSRELDVAVLGEPVTIAMDGELGRKGTRFTFDAHEGALRVYRPAPGPGADHPTRS
ncbi:bifunctional phosphatase PAP2/diacylglycerol kinase family protein [Saccharopolyspora cebuensis]|uniref:Bifunctional phosphatase PAP2/diacylglycerol kinase family protein n=1 Tax=Saccharopolyspora cebuensis TaxID=418759 RepID=A0ABV4CDW8_9PSEU